MKDNNNNHSFKGYEPISSQQMYKIEDIGQERFGMNKVLMMENAGSKVADHIISYCNDELMDKKIIAFAGLGNNGGDSIVALRHLSGYMSSKKLYKNTENIILVLLGDPQKLKTEEAKMNWNIINKMSTIKKIIVNSQQDLDNIKEVTEKSNIILDGIFGTGIKGEIKSPFSEVIDLINLQKSKSFIISIDIPSGLNSDSGESYNKVIIPDVTITFHRIKQGLVNNPNISGKIIPFKIGIPYEAEEGVI